MSRTFVAASAQKATSAGSLSTAVGFTMACWYFSANLPSVTGTPQSLMYMNDNSANNYFGLRVSLADKIQLGTAQGGAPVSVTATAGGQFGSGAIISSFWTHCAATFNTSTSGVVYCDGDFTSGVYAATVPVGINSFDVGDIANIQYANGSIAELAVWNVILTPAEIATLSGGSGASVIGVRRAGVCPLFVRPDALRIYCPMGRSTPENSMIGSGGLSLFNAPAIGAFPPMIYPVTGGPMTRMSGTPPGPLAPIVLPTPTPWRLQRLDLNPRTEGF